MPFIVRIDTHDLSLLKGADYFGMALMAIGLGNLEYVLEEGTRWNWFNDSTILLCAWLAGGSLVLFVARSLTFANPVVDLRAFGNRNFALGCLLSFVTGVGMFTTIISRRCSWAMCGDTVRGKRAWQFSRPAPLR